MFETLFSPEKLLVVAAIGLLLIGPKRLPQIGRHVGKWLGDLRRATGGIAEELKEGLAEPAAPVPVPPPAHVQTVAAPIPPATVAPPAVVAPTVVVPALVDAPPPPVAPPAPPQ